MTNHYAINTIHRAPGATSAESVNQVPKHVEKPEELNSSLLGILAFLGFFGGAILITYAYDNAAVGASHFTTFWLGMILGLTPATLLAVSRRTRKGTQVGLLLGMAIFTTLPEFFLTLHGPDDADADSHFRQLLDTIQTGHLFTPNVTEPLNQNFPGLESASTALHAVSGLDALQCADITIFLAHCLTPLIVFLLALRFGLGPTVPVLAAIVYMANPSYMFFDNQYAYESFCLLYTSRCV